MLIFMLQSSGGHSPVSWMLLNLKTFSMQTRLVFTIEARPWFSWATIYRRQESNGSHHTYDVEPIERQSSYTETVRDEQSDTH